MVIWTECAKGHDLTNPENVTYDPSGNKKCRPCSYPKKPQTRWVNTFDNGKK